MWWRTLRTIGQEITLVRPRPAGPQPALSTGSRRKSRIKNGSRGDSGQASLETIGIFPLLVLLLLTVWQVGIAGMTMVWSGHAANAAARAASVNTDPGQAARDAVPNGMAEDLTVSTDGDQVTVSLRVPIGAPGVGSFPGHITTTRTVVREPNS